MAVPTSLVDVSTTAASNSPAGSESVSTGDDYLRQTQAMLKGAVSKGVDIASGSTLALPAFGSYFVVTGTTTVSAISSTNSWDGREIVLSFAGVLTLTHSATFDLGGTSLKTAAGSEFRFKQISSGTWQLNKDFTLASTAAVARPLGVKVAEVVSVMDFGAVGGGVVDDYAAFAAAWAAIKTVGGTILIPPGTYLLGTQWLLDVDLSSPHNYLIIGYGATLTADAAVTGHAIKVYKSFNNFGVTIEGLHFDHRGNTTVAGCVQGSGSSNLRVINCAVEHHDTKAGYSGIELGPYTPGTADTNSFWSVIDGFRTRMRTGGDGTNAAVAITLLGEANATVIKNCTFSHVDSAIRLAEDGVVAGGICNGCVIRDNFFESVGIAVDMVVTPTTGTVPIGLRIGENRVESATTFVSITTGGAAAIDGAYPPIIQNNYLSASVTNDLVNPNGQFVILDNPTFTGVSSAAVSRYNSAFNFSLRGTQSNLIIANESGDSNYSGAHLVIGAYHLWIEAATGKLRIKSSAPTTDSDGVVVGTQL